MTGVQTCALPICNAKLKSLHAFMDKTNHEISVRVWSKPFSFDKVTAPSGKEFNLINLPFYYVGILDKIVAKIVEQDEKKRGCHI